MANTNYKPLWEKDGGIVVTTTILAPRPGNENKVYLFKDTKALMLWDNDSQSYVQCNDMSRGQVIATDTTVGGFPYPGIPGLTLMDKNGKKYMWFDNGGTHWIATFNFRCVTEEESLTQISINQPFCIPRVDTNNMRYPTLPSPVMMQVRDEVSGDIKVIYPPTILEGGVWGRPNPNEELYRERYPNMPVGTVFVNLPTSQWYLMKDKCNQGAETYSYIAEKGAYI